MEMETSGGLLTQPERFICVVHMAIVDLSLTSHKPLRPPRRRRDPRWSCKAILIHAFWWLSVINEPPCALLHLALTPSTVFLHHGTHPCHICNRIGYKPGGSPTPWRDGRKAAVVVWGDAARSLLDLCLWKLRKSKMDESAWACHDPHRMKATPLQCPLHLHFCQQQQEQHSRGLEFAMRLY